MRPLIKYRGGKRREILEFERFLPGQFDRYIEPFLGGGAVFFHMEPERAVLNDINGRLMGFYQEVRDDYERLSRELAGLQLRYEEAQAAYKKEKERYPKARVENRNEALYYQLRDMYNGIAESPYLQGTLYYFINKTAYSGMIRYNRQGEYNVPFGRYADLNAESITPQHSALLQRAQLYNGDYAPVFALAETGDLMFLDPPYDCTFNDYGNLEMGNGFDEEQHRRLAGDFRNLSCRALMVVGRTPLTETLYRGQIRHSYPKRYAVNIRNRFHAAAEHMVVTNYKV